MEKWDEAKRQNGGSRGGVCVQRRWEKRLSQSAATLLLVSIPCSMLQELLLRATHLAGSGPRSGLCYLPASFRIVKQYNPWLQQSKRWPNVSPSSSSLSFSFPSEGRCNSSFTDSVWFVFTSILRGPSDTNIEAVITNFKGRCNHPLQQGAKSITTRGEDAG